MCAVIFFSAEGRKVNLFYLFIGAYVYYVAEEILQNKVFFFHVFTANFKFAFVDTILLV